MYNITASSNLNIFKNSISFKRKRHKTVSNPQILQNDIFIKTVGANIKNDEIQDLAYKKRICNNKYFDDIKIENLDTSTVENIMKEAN